MSKDHPVIHYDRAIAYIEKKQYGDALEDLDAMIRIAKTAPATPTPVSASPTVGATSTPSQIQTADNQPSRTTDPTVTPTVTPTIPVTGTDDIYSSRFINSDSIIEIVRTTIRDNPELLNYFAENAGKYQQWGDITSDLLALKDTQVSTISAADEEATTLAATEIAAVTSTVFTIVEQTGVVETNAALVIAEQTNVAETSTMVVVIVQTGAASTEQTSTALVAADQASTAFAASMTEQAATPTPTSAPPAPTARPPTPRPQTPTSVSPPPLLMSVEKKGEGTDLRCINVRVFLPQGYPLTTSGWLLVADGLGASAPFNRGGFASVCVPNERQKFRFTILPAEGVQIRSGNSGIPAKGGDIFEAYTQQ